MSKQSNVVNNDVIKRTVYDKLVTKVDAIDIVDWFLKLNITLINQEYKKKLTMLTRKYLIPVLLLRKDYNGKITETEGKIPMYYWLSYYCCS